MQSPIDFDSPSFLCILVHVLFSRLVEKRCGKRCPRLGWKFKRFFQQLAWVLLHITNSTLVTDDACFNLWMLLGGTDTALPSN